MAAEKKDELRVEMFRQHLTVQQDVEKVHQRRSRFIQRLTVLQQYDSCFARYGLAGRSFCASCALFVYPHAI